MAEPDCKADARRRAQIASTAAKRSRLVTLLCKVCGSTFDTTADRMTAKICDVCRPAYKREQSRVLSKARTREQRQAERRRIAEANGMAYRTAEERAAVATANAATKADERKVKRPKLTADEMRERGRLRSARKYLANRQREIQRVLDYKKRNRDKNVEWGHRRRAKARGGYIEPVNIQSIRESRKSCIYCGVRLDIDQRTLDHLVPVANGGEHSARNLVVCCLSCNSGKGSMPLDEWLAKLPPRGRATV
jgi:5-methylcytosine-specific restriction endonuclease McrA